MLACGGDSLTDRDPHTADRIADQPLWTDRTRHLRSLASCPAQCEQDQADNEPNEEHEQQSTKES